MAKDNDGINFVTDDETGGFFVYCCTHCNEIGNSKDMHVEGGYDDDSCYCPKCDEPDPEEHDNVAEVWNHQQRKINTKDIKIKRLEAALFRAGKWLTADSDFNLSDLDCEISELLPNTQ